MAAARVNGKWRIASPYRVRTSPARATERSRFTRIAGQTTTARQESSVAGIGRARLRGEGRRRFRLMQEVYDVAAIGKQPNGLDVAPMLLDLSFVEGVDF